jgi:hypothetical protein
MAKLFKTTLVAVFILINCTIATYSNLLYNATSIAQPGLYTSMCGTSETAWATDRVITRGEIDWCYDWPGYLFMTSYNSTSQSSLTITLP